MNRSIVAFATCIWMLANAGSAQSRTCRIVYPERPDGQKDFVYLFDGTKSHKILLPSMNLSEPVALADGELTLSLSVDKMEGQTPMPEDAPRLTIPEDVRNFYIIVSSDPANKNLPIQMTMADVGKHKLAPGETLWYNFTEHRIVANLGGSDMSVSPGESAVSKAPSGGGGYYEVQFQYQVRGEGELTPITDQNWWHDPKSKSLGFIVDTGGRLPKILTFRDIMAADDHLSGGEEAVPEEQ